MIDGPASNDTYMYNKKAFQSDAYCRLVDDGGLGGGAIHEVVLFRAGWYCLGAAVHGGAD